MNHRLFGLTILYMNDFSGSDLTTFDLARGGGSRDEQRADEEVYGQRFGNDGVKGEIVTRTGKSLLLNYSSRVILPEAAPSQEADNGFCLWRGILPEACCVQDCEVPVPPVRRSKSCEWLESSFQISGNVCFLA